MAGDQCPPLGGHDRQDLVCLVPGRDDLGAVVGCLSVPIDGVIEHGKLTDDLIDRRSHPVGVVPEVGIAAGGTVVRRNREGIDTFGQAKHGSPLGRGGLDHIGQSLLEA